MKKLLFPIILIIMTGMFSCSTEFEVNAPWKDISVVYCLLNPNDSVHYVKLNKCFLGEENAYTMAQISDSSNYADATIILVPGKILDYGDFGESGDAISFERTTEFPKDSGVFANDNNVIYKTTDAITMLDIEKDYKLKISIPGKDEIYSQTPLIQATNIAGQYSYLKTVGFTESGSETIEWNSVENAKIYELTIHFTYLEITDSIAVEKTIRWPQNRKIAPTTEGGTKMSMTIQGSNFLEFVSSSIKSNPNYDQVDERIVKQFYYTGAPKKYGALQFYFFLGAEDLNTYIEISSPSNTIVQEKPAYTNISNGIGIFSCRVDNTVENVRLSDRAIDDLSGSDITKDLKFRDNNGTIGYWSVHIND
ncbi:MAG: hypothetical protein ABIJ16_13205 [Bacteroidota bacterium]